MAKSNKTKPKAAPTNIEERIGRVADEWFLTEPALFAIYCTHELRANEGMEATFRSGQRRIEYNPPLADKLNDAALEQHLRAEAIRILLKHPYERRPANCSASSITMGSDCVVTSYYTNLNEVNDLAKPIEFGLPERESYEWYSHKIEEMLTTNKSGNDKSDNSSETSATNNESSDDSNQSNDEQSETKGEQEKQNDQEDANNEAQDQNNDPTKNDNGQQNDESDDDDEPQEPQEQQEPSGRQQTNGSSSAPNAKASQSELWEEDQMQQCEINELIESTTNWGNLPGNLVEMIVASTKARIDFRKVMAGFRASILSSRRNLTRMRPNRRTEFENMGSVYRLRSKLLVAVDTSGSVRREDLQNFIGVVNKFFRYGVEQIDLMLFDTIVQSIEPMSKANKTKNIMGRGGTSFQCVIDYVAKAKSYDGLIIMTDGDADQPSIPTGFRTSILWVCCHDNAYKRNKDWLQTYGRVMCIESK